MTGVVLSYRGDGVVVVAGFVDVVSFLREVKMPVLVEVAVGERMSGSSGDFERRSIQMLCVVRLIIL